MGKYLAYAMISLNILAAIGYAFDGDWRRVVYWLAAACLTTCVTV